MSTKRIIAKFQPQQWVNDYAVDSDPVQEVDVTAKVLALDLKDIRSLRDNRDNTDELVDFAEQGHSGPGYVRVTDSVCAFFGVGELAKITPKMLAKERQALKVFAPSSRRRPVTAKRRTA